MSSTTLARIAFVAVLAQYLLALGSFGFWVARDADARGSRHVALWGIVSAFTGGLAGLAYLSARSDVVERTRPPTRGERAAQTVLLAVLPAWVLAATFAPPDPFTQMFYELGLFAVVFPLAYVLDYRDGYARLRRRVG